MDLATAQTLVFSTLQQATSQNSDVLKPAEQKLKEWETIPGFYTILFNIFSTPTVDINVRWLAVLYFKNGVDRYWRKGAPNGIPEEEKASIKHNIILNFGEPVHQIATQLAVVISKIARIDCPREWGELIPTLLMTVKSEDELQQHRALLTLHHVIKALSSKRLVGDRRLFQELTVSVYSFMVSLWDSQTCLAISQLQSPDVNPNEVNKVLENAVLSLRILTKLTVNGLKKPHDFPVANTFLNMVFSRAKTMLQCRVSTKPPLQAQTERFIIKLAKVLLSQLENHPLSFVDFLPATLSFTVHYAFTPEGTPLLFQRFLIQCLNLIKSILLCAEYKPAKTLKDTKEPETLRAHQIYTSFFETSVLNAICRKLITHYFLLTQQDLQQWDIDPEGFVTEEGWECIKYNLRPCIESLFLALFHTFRGTLTPVVIQLIAEHHGFVDPYNLPAILAKDAVYNAVGLAAFDLFDEVNIDEWFTTTLAAELKIKEGNYRIIRRRVASLLGHWTGVKLSIELRPALYEAMLPLLRPDEDTAIRLTACSTIKCAVDDFHFDTEQFLNYIDPLFEQLFGLLKDVHECDTKMHVLGVLSFVIERVGAAIRPCAQSLVQYLPVLWHESSDHNMLRCTIVSTLVHLVKALGTLSEAPVLSEFLLSVVQLSIDPRHPSHVYLLEDGLELWFTILENTTSISQPLLHLYTYMSSLLELSNAETLNNCFAIIQAYVLLSPDLFVQHYGEAVVSSCAYLMTDLSYEGVLLILKLYQTCLRACPEKFISILEPALPRIFQSVYDGEEPSTMVMTMYLVIIARILLLSKQTFGKVVVHLAELLGVSLDTVTARILDVWLDKMSLVNVVERSKLLALALSSLLNSQSLVVLHRFTKIVLCVTWVLNDIKTDPLLWSGQEDLSTDSPVIDVDCRTEHELRKERMQCSDPLDSMDLQTYFRTQLVTLKSQLGPERFSQLIQSVDGETQQQMYEYVVL